nr:retrovirus-related Pol polyprotein from transposon TNT 1-94 [Tanacetum cinerariifolium]
MKKISHLQHRQAEMLLRHGYWIPQLAIILHHIESGLNDDGIIVTLKGVRYLPKLKKNLISIGTLESKGFEGRTIVGTIAAITDGDINSEAVKLWHMHLGHAREKSLNFLIKQGLLKDLVPDEVLGVFIKWKKMMETQTCRKIKHLQTNNGEEYKNDLFTKFYEDKGIVRHFTVRNTPQQNGVAKRMNQALLEKVRCMLSNAGLGKEFWAEAVTYVCHLVNRFPLIAINRKTPFEKWYGKPATDYDSLHVFDSATYYHVKESKLDPRAKKALFMRITYGIKGYRLWCPETKTTIFSRDVTFNESAMLKKVNVEQLDGTLKKVEFERIIIPADRETNDNSPMVEGDYKEEEVQTKEPPHQQHESIVTNKPKRNTKRPARLNDTVAYASLIIADDVPTTYSEVVRDSKNEK